MSIAVRGNYVAVRRPAATATRVSKTTRGTTRQLIIVGATIIGLLCAYGHVYSTTLFLEHQVDLNRSAIQAQLQQQETLLIKDTSLTSPDRVRAVAATMGLAADNAAVIGTLSSLH